MTTLFFAAGSDDESHGLFGRIAAPWLRPRTLGATPAGRPSSTGRSPEQRGASGARGGVIRRVRFHPDESLPFGSAPGGAAVGRVAALAGSVPRPAHPFPACPVASAMASSAVRALPSPKALSKSPAPKARLARSIT